uniref:Zinc finger transcription factor 1 n=2 Tax=Fusarium oxysporum TaxID=5507 RepID=Q2V9X3_FUSOX|nr:zinc finger transcription factor 1 [Fusarium oxysporum]
MSGHAVFEPSTCPIVLRFRSQLYRDVPELHAVPSPSHSALMDFTHFDDVAFAYYGLPDQSSLVSLLDHTHTFQSPTAFPQHQAMSGLAHSGLPFGTLPTGNRSQSMEGSKAPPDRTSPASNAFENPTTDEFGLASCNRADGTDLGGKPKEDKAGATPAWSGLKTKAGKERKRLPLACIACRRKKVRCSGEKPACKHCLHSHIPCVYKVTTRKAAPRTNYMVMLDKRPKCMEERIIKAIPKSDQEVASSVTRPVVKPVIPRAVLSNKPTRKRGAEEAFGPDLEAWAKAPSKPKIEGDDRPSSLQAQEGEENKLQHEGTEALPSEEIQEHLAEVFFDNIYGQSYHLLHKPSYLRKLKNGTLPPVLVLTVCAVAARFTSNPLVSSSGPEFLRGEEWASHAREICTRQYEWPSLTILTCLLILGLHEFGTCQGSRSWALSGQAIRMAFALQLHKDLGYDSSGRNGAKTQLNFNDRETRRHILWACFPIGPLQLLLGQDSTHGSSREDSIQIPLPVKGKVLLNSTCLAPTELLDDQVPHPPSPNDGQIADARENMGVAAFLIRAIALWGRIITYLSQGCKDLDPNLLWEEEPHYIKHLNDAVNLEASLPLSLNYSAENLEVHKTENAASQFLFMHICLQHNILLVSRAAMSARKQQGVHDDFFSEASHRTFIAANRISEFLREAQQSRCFVSAPFAGYCAFSSATVHILGIISCNPSMKPTSRGQFDHQCQSTFTKNGRSIWGIVSLGWGENVRTQYRNVLHAMRAGVNVEERATQLSFLQYGDWYNRYPRGLSDAEFMDPATHKRKDSGADGVLEAKPELRSVEEYSTLPTPRRVENKDTIRAAAPKRKQSAKIICRLVMPAQPGQASRFVADYQMPTQSSQKRKFSGGLGLQITGAAGFNPLSASNQQNPDFSTTMSPTSPANMTPFSHYAHTPTFFPPELLSIDFGQGSNGNIDPLDRQLIYGGYSMDASTGLCGGQDMMSGLGWDTVASGAQPDGCLQGRPPNVKAGMHGQSAGMADGAGLSGPEASSAWFMPFNMEAPDMDQNPGFNMGGFDPFTGVLGGGSSGLATPNALGGLQQQGH